MLIAYKKGDEVSFLKAVIIIGLDKIISLLY